MSNELAKRVNSNLSPFDTTPGQDIGSALMKFGGVGMVWSLIALLPFIGVPFFVTLFSVGFIAGGGYMRYVR